MKAGMVTDVRRLLRLDGAATMAAAVVALAVAGPLGDALDVSPGSVRLAGLAFAVLGVDAMALSAVPARRLVPATVAFAAVREITLVVMLVLAARAGAVAAEVVLAAFLLEAVVLGLLELRAARGSSRPVRAAQTAAPAAA